MYAGGRPRRESDAERRHALQVDADAATVEVDLGEQSHRTEVQVRRRFAELELGRPPRDAAIVGREVPRGCGHDDRASAFEAGPASGRCALGDLVEAAEVVV